MAIGPQVRDSEEIRFVSDLAKYPFVVLLGEPGSGKTSTLRAEARKEGAVVVTARELIYRNDAGNGASEESVETLYVDAIDEYRSEGDRSDKAWGLTAAMGAVNSRRWRVACRSEDWRSEADIKPFLRLTNNERPVVVQLQALQGEEVLVVLRYLGEEAPEQFIETAYSFGANGLLQTPLSIKLLHRAVEQNGQAWPKGRFDLFSAATKALAVENNDDYEGRLRLSAERRLALAGRISLVMLLSGAEHVWRSNKGKDDAGIDPRRLVDADELGVEISELSDVLDSSLFKGEGRRFEPMHRTIAEFLAARTLARTVLGIDSEAAFPLSRAIALISGFDGSPPTELRGLYAWFAAHLSVLEDNSGADRLIQADAVSVLAYGDASVFPVEARRAILFNLTKEDPYFRASGDWFGTDVVAFGGLACEELAADFSNVLERAEDEGHLLVTVFEVLSTGKPVASVRPLLLTIVLDVDRPEWQRVRAVKAWLNWPDDRSERHELLRVLAQEAPSIAREKIRVELAVALASGPLDQSIVKSILSSFEECPEDNTVGHLTALQLRMREEPSVEFFDEPVSSWRSKAELRPRSGEVDELLDQVLAATIRHGANLTGERIWRWLCSVDKNIWAAMKRDSSDALAGWLKGGEGRGNELFDAILSSDQPSNGPWLVGNIYTHLTGRHPSAAQIQRLLERARQEATSTLRHHLLSIVVELARSHAMTERSDCFWAVHDVLVGSFEYRDHLTRLIQDDWSLEHPQSSAYRIVREPDDAKTAASNVEKLAPLLPEIAVGNFPEVLRWGADLYFAPNLQDELPIGVDRVIYYSDAQTAAAIVDGCRLVPTGRFAGLTAADIGVADARNQLYPVEFAAIAGVDMMLDAMEFSTLESVRVEIAISILRLSYLAHNQEQRQRLEKWACARIARTPTDSLRCLTEYWRAALAAGAEHLSLTSQLIAETGSVADVVGGVVGTLLTEEKTLPLAVLKQLVHAASRLLSTHDILAMAETAADDESIPLENRTVWKYVAFYLDPQTHHEQFMRDSEGQGLVELFDSFSGNDLASHLAPIGASGRTIREGIAVQLFGKWVSPSSEFEINSAQGRARQIVHKALQWLSASGDQASGDVLRRLEQEPSLAHWRSLTRHALANFKRARRDAYFAHPTPESIKSALLGGPPTNGADLFSVVVEELRRLSKELQSDDVSPWKRYWNVDSDGNPTGPLIENECRDRLLERLRDRLKPYKIAPPMPEARRAYETRADIISLTAIGHTVPVEAKRNNHPDVWTAAATQLQGYANAAGADGHGIYLVFWFGNAPNKTPSRPDGSEGPQTAEHMEAMLIADLPTDIAKRTEVVVFDVSNPEKRAAKAAQKRQRKAL
ncbi:NACHT domain-containing protein [Paraburkholderia phytofirmans]|nr:hypothetical protein [Paraburkholderia phytofirmans]